VPMAIRIPKGLNLGGGGVIGIQLL
jgi:hypothetical protein